MTDPQRPVRPGAVGLVPAAGHATRIAPLPCSKELLPVGLRETEGDGGSAQRPQVACHCLFERMRHAGVGRAFVVLGQGKWDIPAYIDDGALFGLNIAYLTVRDSQGAAFTVDRAFPFVNDSLVAFGFPDILFTPVDAFDRLFDRQAATDADVVLGLFPTRKPHKADMVESDNHGAVRRILVKPASTQLELTWIIALWTPAFTTYLHTYARERMSGRGLSATGREVHVGNVIQAAIEDDMHIDSVAIPDGIFRDIGTPEDLAATLRDMGGV